MSINPINSSTTADSTMIQTDIVYRGSAGSATTAADITQDSTGSDKPADSTSVTLSDQALQLGSATNTASAAVQAYLDAPSPVPVKAKKLPKQLSLLNIDAFRVMRAKLKTALLGQKSPNQLDEVAAKQTDVPT